MQPKSIYTLPELKKSSTIRLISIYNRLFKLNAWEEFFNPYSARVQMLMEIWAEMEALEAAMAAPAVEKTERKPYKALEIVVTPNGFALIWTAEKSKKNKVTINPAQMAVVRAMREDGETYSTIVAVTGLTKTSVFRVLKGEYAIEATRWNKRGNFATV